MTDGYEVEILADALIDISDARDWYNQKSEGLGSLFVAEIKNGIGLIQKSPHLFPIVYRLQRKYVCSKFPYKIFYKILNEEMKVAIYAVVHDKESSKKLMKRKTGNRK